MIQPIKPECLPSSEARSIPINPAIERKEEPVVLGFVVEDMVPQRFYWAEGSMGVFAMEQRIADC